MVPFSCLTILLFLVSLLVTSSIPAAAGSILDHSPDANRTASDEAFYIPSNQGELKSEEIRISNDAAPGAFADGKASWCEKPPKFPVGKPVDVIVATPSGDRRFVLYIPLSYTRRRRQGGGQAAVALQLLFHGLQDECHSFLEHTGFMAYAEKDGFILASACGTIGWLGRGWNAGTCCGFFSDTPDDLEFAHEVVRVVSNGVCVDPAKVLAVGFSNGAMLSEVLACTMPEVFRAVASVSGVVEMSPGNEEGLQVCTSALRNHSSRASVLMIHGDDDFWVPWDGFYLMGFPSIMSNTLGWASRTGCNIKSSHTTINTTEAQNILYDVCSPNQNGGIDNGVDPMAFSATILSENKGKGSPSPTAASTRYAQSRYFSKTKNGIVRLSKEERMYQNKAFIAYLYRSATYPQFAADVPKESETKAKTEPLSVELVRLFGQGHSWYEGENFSTTAYIHNFGLKVFGSY